MISILYRASKDEQLKQLSEIKKGAWVNIVNPTKAEIAEISKLTKIEKEFIIDTLDPDELPRIEKSEDITYVILNVPYEENGEILSAPFLIAITPDLLVTLSPKRLKPIEQILQRNIYTTKKTKNILEISLKVVDLYEQEIRKINKSIYTKKVNLSKLTNKDIINFVGLEKILNKFVTSLIPTISIFEKILSGKYVKIYKDDQELTEDLIIDSQQCLNMCRGSIKNVTNIRQAYSTILTNDLNRVMKFLTSLTIIIGVPTIIASLYGMNVKLPLQGNIFAFVYICLFTLIACLVLAFIFYFKKWF